MTPFVGFMPDLLPTAEGVFQDCENIIPTARGFMASGSPIDVGVGTLAEDALQLAVVEDLNANKRTFVGTANYIYEIQSGAYVDVSRVGGNTTATDWQFAQFGNYTLAVNNQNLLQVSYGSGDFADVANTPVGKFVAVSKGYVMMANLKTDETGTSYNTDSQADGGDWWHCTPDYTDWTPDVYADIVKAKIAGGGAFTGLKELGGGFVLFKENTMYYGTYVGAPLAYDFVEVTGNVGCPSGDAAVNAADVLFFLGNDDFYAFDGARPVPIGEGVREWFFKDASKDLLDKTIAVYNPYSSNVTWFYASNDSNGNPDTALVYNIRTRKWGKYNQDVQAAAKYFSNHIVIDDAVQTDLAALYATIDDMTDVPFDSDYWSEVTIGAGIIDNRVLYQLAGTAQDSSISYGVMGDDDQYSMVSRVTPRFLQAPESSTLEYRYDDDYGDQFTLKTTSTLQNGKYDLLHSAKWHTFKFNFVGNMEITGARFHLKQDGAQ